MLEHGPKVVPVISMDGTKTGPQGPKRSDVPLSDNSGGSCVYCGDGPASPSTRGETICERCAEFLEVAESLQPDQRCESCGGLVNVLSPDYSDRCLDCRLNWMSPYAEGGR